MVNRLSVEEQNLQKYPNLCFEDEYKFYGFGTTYQQVNNGRIKIVGQPDPLSAL